MRIAPLYEEGITRGLERNGDVHDTAACDPYVDAEPPAERGDALRNCVTAPEAARGLDAARLADGAGGIGWTLLRPDMARQARRGQNDAGSGPGASAS